MPAKYEFLGDPARRPANPHPDSPQEEPYIASDELKQAVNLAIYLRRPLLLEGEPGCGKTRLARAVAYELGLPLYSWHVRSTSKATEGLYTYDALARLHDVQLSQRSVNPKRNPAEAALYLAFGALGKAFQMADRPAVVLIDEIDKADLDFPNDLLAALDEWQFEIPETGEKIMPAHEDCKPIIIITSNRETGDLPAPFLRRCLYHCVNFPDDDALRRIIAEHARLKQAAPPKEPLINAALGRFRRLRESGLHKNPGTSELLDWLNALQHFGARPYAAETLNDKSAALPYPEVLLKMKADWPRRLPAQA